MTLASELKRLRQQAGLSQQELGERSGLTQQAIALLERGARKNPRVRTIIAIAAALEVTAEQMIAAMQERSPARRRQHKGGK